MPKLASFRTALLACCLSVAMAGAADAQPGEGRQWRNFAQTTANSASIDQQGAGNTGAVVQTGEGNTALLRQSGDGNTGSITQVGNNNSACLFQLGRRLDGSISQLGDDQSLAIVQTRAGMHPVPIQVCSSQMGGRRLGRARANSHVGADRGSR